ncbi:MAG: hypothetical protein SCALA702_11720 [Melioribacteraceae bacterium]|nr:MAG: hypothetical protein SCALA702_11720 [Melioribacteraceae bacterium]
MKLKVLLAVILLGFSVIACGNSDAKGDDTGLVWHENLETAIEVAKVEDKNIFINFTGSDWCKWCIKLNGEVFTKSEFAEYAREKLVLVKLDFPRYTRQPEAVVAYNRNLMNKFRVGGFPTNILLNNTGEYVGAIGYQAGGPAKYVESLEQVYGKK